MEEKTLTLQTDDGRLHADECAAITLLTNYYAKKEITVSISRGKEIDFSNVLIGIGGEYNPESMHFDHHQRHFNEKWPSSDVLLSSAGLIWRHYGKEIVEMYLTANPEEYDYSDNYTMETIEELTNIIYFNLILQIDANENGENGKENNSKLNITNLINDINSDETDPKQNFQKAITLLGQIFDIKFKKIINSYFNFPKDLDILKKYNLSNPYLIIKEKIPTVFKCLNHLDPDANIKFLIFVNNDEYTIKTRHNRQSTPLVPIASEKILRSKVSNSEQIIFLHKACFSAKTKDLATAIEIVIYSLENYKNIISCQIEEAKKEEVNTKEDSIKDVKTTFFTTRFIFGTISVICLASLGYYFIKHE